MRRLLGPCALISLAGTLLVQAHPDDPKPLDRLPRYEGPGYLAIEGTPPPVRLGSTNVFLQSFIPISTISGSAFAANDCWGYTSPSGREYALIGVSNATGFVEVTNPAAASLVDSFSGPSSDWRDIKTYGTHAYAVSEGGGGIQVFDMSDIDNGNITQLSSITNGGSTTATHNVAIDTTSGFLYRCGGGGEGLRIYDLSNPAAPSYVASWPDRYVHDAQIVTYTSGPYAGRQIAFCASGFGNGSVETGLDILDVTNKGSIQVLSRSYYSSAAYSHQLWLSPDRQYLYLNDELDESSYGNPTRTRILDVSDLANPVEVSAVASSNPSIDHNLYVRGSMIFEANYRSGLRVFDATDAFNPVEVGYYDTFASDDNPSFNGLWSNYPFFDSGTIIGSDIEQGLFVWTLGHELSVYYPEGRPERIDAAGQSIAVEIIENVPGSLVGTPTLFYDDGSGFQSVPLTPTGGLTYTADFPATTCNGAVDFYISLNSGSATYTSPVNAPASTFKLLAIGSENVISVDDFESGSGWTVNFDGSDDASTGVWTRGNPNGTIAQPEDDYSPAGTDCWFTGQGSVGGGLGDNDVDGGTTTLTSPTLDLSGLTNPQISFRQWYSNTQGASPNADTFLVELSANNGGSWVTADSVTTGAGTAGGWALNRIIVSDVIAPTATMRIRFSASDLGSGSIVEAAIDDFTLSDLECPVIVICPQDFNGDGNVDLTDLATLLANFGLGSGASNAQGDADLDGDVDLSDLASLLAAFGTSCE